MLTNIRLGWEDIRTKIKKHDKGFSIFMLAGIFFWLFVSPGFVIVWSLLWMALTMNPVDVPVYPLMDTINEEYEAMLDEERTDD